MTAAPLEARYQLMRRLAGDRALTGRHADQLRALSAPDALFLTIDPADDEPRGAAPAGGSGPAAGPAESGRSDRLLLRAAVVARPIGDGRRAAQPGHARAPGARARRDRRDRRRRGCASRFGPFSGWRAAAACWATTFSTASAISSARSSPRRIARCTWCCRCRAS